MTQKTTAIFGIAVLAAILLGGLTFSQSAFAGQGGGQNKVTICHQGDEGPETITVAAPAIPAHLAHGDTLGPCVEEPTGDRILSCLCDLPENEDLETPLEFLLCVEDSDDGETVEELFAFCNDFCGLGPDNIFIGFVSQPDDPACTEDLE